ncbi:MAG: OmpH family outer membrane protein [Salinivirgaceae bacterium]|nr:OmpH family outer membrane protein [Salinivirgaceae bacterium]
MKNLSLGLNIVLFIGLGVLYFLHFSANKSTVNTAANTNAANAQTGDLKIAYVNIDSVLFQYNLSVDMNDAITKRGTNMKAKLEKEATAFEKDAQVFQDKVQRGIFLTQQRAEEAQQQLVMRQQELQKLEYDYTNQLSVEQQRMNAQLFDSVSNFIKEFNTPEQFQIILGHSVGGNMFYGSEKLDITRNVIDGLNGRLPKKD